MLREKSVIATWMVLIALYFTKDRLFSSSNGDSEEKLFTVDELAQFDGSKAQYLYLSIMGQVFDVTQGSKHYGEGKSYNFFVGKDASRSFVNGNFECRKNCDDVTGLSPQEFRALNNWVELYRKNYEYVGKLVGKYYKDNGEMTPYGKQIQDLVSKALLEETEEDRLKMIYPGCNLEWDLDRGTHVWCTDQSGGIKRNWVGFPRKFFAPGSKAHRCACIKGEDLRSSSIKEYENCDPKSNECFIKE